jgi:hypothetical protein
MTSTLRSEWRILRRAAPGRRFQESYAASRRHPDHGTFVRRAVRVGLAVIAMAIGVVLIFLPGPAVLFFAITGALLATESLTVARMLDWVELRLRAVAHWLVRRWRAMSGLQRVLAIATIVLGGSACAFGLYQLTFARA